MCDPNYDGTGENAEVNSKRRNIQGDSLISLTVRFVYQNNSQTNPWESGRMIVTLLYNPNRLDSRKAKQITCKNQQFKMLFR